MVKKHNIRLYVILTLISAMFLALLPFDLLKVHAATGRWKDDNTYVLDGKEYNLSLADSVVDDSYIKAYYYTNEEVFLITEFREEAIKNGTYGDYNWQKGMAGKPVSQFIITEGVQTIGKNAFLGTSNTCDLILPNSVTTIGDGAFRNCNLNNKFKFPSSLKVIGNNAFYGATITGNLVIPDTVTSIENGAFRDCKLDGTLKLSNTLENIGAFAFSGCKGLHGELELPNTLKTIGKGAFAQCTGFTGNLVIPNSVISIGADITNAEIISGHVTGAFSGCTGFNGTLTLGNSLEIIGEASFSGCSNLKGDLIIPNSVKALGTVEYTESDAYGKGAFAGCSGFKGELRLSESLTIIPTSSFQDCSGLNGNLIIPDSVEKIGVSAFDGCTGMGDTIVISKNAESISSRAFAEMPNVNIVELYSPNLGWWAAGNDFQPETGSFYVSTSTPTTINTEIYEMPDYYIDLRTRGNWDFMNRPLPNNIRVEFDSNGGTEVEAQMPMAGEKVLEPKNVIKKDKNGETLALEGWFTEEEYNNEWNFDTDIAMNSMTLYANWDEIVGDWTVTFDTDGGSYIAPKGVIEDTEGCGYGYIGYVEPPTKEGYIFDHWQNWTSGGNYKTEELNNAQIWQDTTLKAIWTKPKQKFNITFDLDGGNINGSTTIEPIEVEEYSEGCGWGYIGTDVGIPVKEGFIFDYWEPVFTNDLTYAQVSADTELKAIYYEDPDYGNGGEGGTAHIYIDYNDTGDYVLFGEVEYGNALSEQPEEPQKSGYTFQYWYYLDIAYDDDGNPICDEEGNPIENMVRFDFNSEVYVDYYLKPYFTENTGDTKNKYTVTFDTNGGTPVESQEITDGETVSKPTNPTKAEDDNYKYTFAGWYTEDGTEFNFSNPITADTVLIAHWNKEDINNPEEPENPENPDDGHLVGDTITDFSVDNDILDDGKPDDVLGGDLIVSIPAELRLAYTSNGATFTKEDKVYAVGRVHSTDYLKILTPTNIEYTPDDATEELLAANPEARVPGVISFGDTENNNQASKWLASELLLGVGKGSVTEGTSRTISSTVQKSDIKFIGSYRSVIDYNITLYQPNINRKVITEDLSQYENNQKPLTKEQLKELIEKNAEPIG